MNDVQIVEGDAPELKKYVGSLYLGGDTNHASTTFITELRVIKDEPIIKRCIDAWNNKEASHLRFNLYGDDVSLVILALKIEHTAEGKKLILYVRV